MTLTRPTTETTPAVPTVESASERADETLRSAGYESITVSLPHRTRSTWIVPATTASGPVRVHVDPRSGQTRVVEAVETSTDDDWAEG